MGSKLIRTCAFLVALTAAVGTGGSIVPDAEAATWSRVEQTVPDATYRASWTDARSSAASGGTFTRSRRKGDNASLTFGGTGVRLIGPKARTGGIVTLTLDGVRVAKIDTYSRRTRHQAVLFERSGLTAGTHTLVATVTGKRNRKARRGYASIDAFEVNQQSVTPSTHLLSDDFEAFGPSETWPQGSTRGAWQVQYHGYGSVGTASDGSVVHRQAPRPSTSLGETHASLVTSTRSFGNFSASMRVKTVRQLRTPTPNAWETAWVLWGWTRDESFYYFIPKPNGWELGKVDDSKADPNGPECTWPAYNNCRHDGAQVYLATGSSPRFPVGAWYTVDVTQVGNRMTVSVDGTEIVDYTDTDNPYTSGALGLYNEDAEVFFDDIVVDPVL